MTWWTDPDLEAPRVDPRCSAIIGTVNGVEGRCKLDRGHADPWHQVLFIRWQEHPTPTDVPWWDTIPRRTA